jgi:hypothetical protein
MISLETIINPSQYSALIAEKKHLGWTIRCCIEPTESKFKFCEMKVDYEHIKKHENEANKLEQLDELLKNFNSVKTLDSTNFHHRTKIEMLYFANKMAEGIRVSYVHTRGQIDLQS